MQESKTKIRLNTERCKGCLICMDFCLVKAIAPSGELGLQGYEVVAIDERKCVQCASCYRMCPDYAIELL